MHAGKVLAARVGHYRNFIFARQPRRDHSATTASAWSREEAIEMISFVCSWTKSESRRMRLGVALGQRAMIANEDC